MARMARRSLIEQLDEAVQAIIIHPSTPLPGVDVRIAPLISVAAELRDLPRPDFKARLKADLEREISSMRNSMLSNSTRSQGTTTAVNPIREGFHTITPYLIVDEAAGLIDFVKDAFGADELYRGTGSGAGIHCEVRIGDSMVMIGGGGGLRVKVMPTSLHLYVNDTDAVYQRALQAGATSVAQPVDQSYGDREAGVKDLAGNYWWIATHKGKKYIPEGLRSVTPYLHPRGADRMVDFLKRAFGAEESGVYRSPDGTIVHAKVRIGSSLIEMGEAHGEYQPMPTTIYMYVENADAVYKAALAAGGTSLSEPADQPYGDRNGGVRDPFGNEWYIATHISDVGM